MIHYFILNENNKPRRGKNLKSIYIAFSSDANICLNEGKKNCG